MSKKPAKEMAVSDAPPDPEERRRKYNRAVRQANLVTILLSKIDFKVNRDVKRPAKGEGNSSVPSYGGKLVKFQYNDEAKAFIASVAWTVEIKVGRQTYAKCLAHYDVIYNGFSDVDEEIVELFAENVARPATYTYFRALFASLDWSSELRLPPLPVIKFHPKV
ncbi:hypothetical protein [Methylorubrum sp. SL192]|uniref:hypothetical protein n=1 Tax=Methylorubrum sp. SL192 TaxID=2995167 RepID=UPI00227459E3|nr:hypothetical protein [Methylorubrum sp. SL192]MCY1642112.1 hypothetical protein [Methylorubrum sp. SL192]